MLRLEGWQVNYKRVERIWQREGQTPNGVKCLKNSLNAGVHGSMMVRSCAYEQSSPIGGKSKGVTFCNEKLIELFG